jgi:hypothetical protein
LNWTDLKKAGAERAHSIILFSNNSFQDDDEEAHKDADAVLSWLNIQANSNKKHNVIVEIGISL